MAERETRAHGMGVCAGCGGVLPYWKPVGSRCGSCEWFASPGEDQDPDGDYLRPSPGEGVRP